MKQANVRLTNFILPCSVFFSLVSLSHPVCALPTLEELVSSGERIEISVNKSQLVLAETIVTRVSVVASEVADVQILDPKQILVSAKTVGQTSLIIWTEDGKTRTIEVAVNCNTDQIKEAIQKVFPDEAIEVIPLADAVALRGYVSEISVVKQVVEITESFGLKAVNLLTVPGSHQVLLRVKIAEVSRTFRSQKGIDLFVTDWDVSDDFFVTTNLYEGIGLGDSTMLFFNLPEDHLSAFIQFMKDRGLLHMLAEPNLIARSGETASFLAGGEIPIPVAQAGAVAGAITIEYKEYGVRLNFTPTVITEETIRLDIAPEVSELDYARSVTVAGHEIPGISTRRAQTVVKLDNGQTFAIAGLVSQSKRKSARRNLPFGGIPVVGTLFRGGELRAEETELLIMVTPHLIAPLDSEEPYKMPLDYSAPIDQDVSVREVSAMPPGGDSPVMSDAHRAPFEYQERLKEEKAYRARRLAQQKSGTKSRSQTPVTEKELLSGKGVATIQR